MDRHILQSPSPSSVLPVYHGRRMMPSLGVDCEVGCYQGRFVRIRYREPISGTLMQEPFSVPDTFFFPDLALRGHCPGRLGALRWMTAWAGDRAPWRHDPSAVPGTKTEGGRHQAALPFPSGLVPLSHY